MKALIIAAACAVSTTLLLAAYFARRVVVPRTACRRGDLPVRNVSEGNGGSLLIEFPSALLTKASGRYSLWFAAGEGRACIGPVATEKFNTGTVTRLVERVDAGDLPAATAGIWSGYSYSKPEQLGIPSEDVEIPVDGGAAPV